jgi:hypothetical protein
VLWKILEPKRDEVTGEWRRLHKEELYNLYFSININQVILLRRMRWAEHVACMWKRSAYKVSVERPDRKRPLGRPRHR